MQGNMKQIMKQAQKAQQEMEKKQEELGLKQVEASSGGGMVKVVANGREEIVDITIDPEVVSAEEVDMLEDLILAALKEAQGKAKEMASREMETMMRSLGLPPGMGGF